MGVMQNTPKYSNLKKNLSDYKIGALIFCDKQNQKPEARTSSNDFKINNYLPRSYANCDAY